MPPEKIRTISFVNFRVFSVGVFTSEGHPLDKESMLSKTLAKTKGKVVVVAYKFGVKLGGDLKLVHQTQLIFSLVCFQALLYCIAPPRQFIHQRSGSKYERLHQCRVEKNLLWEIMRTLATTGNDLRVGNELFYSKSKIINKTNRFQPCPY